MEASYCNIEQLISRIKFKAGDRQAFQACVIGKATNAKDGFYVSVPLAKEIPTNLTITLTDMAQYGFASTGGSGRSLDFNDITAIEAYAGDNNLRFRVGATGISDANEICYLRIQGIVTFS